MTWGDVTVTVTWRLMTVTQRSNLLVNKDVEKDFSTDISGYIFNDLTNK